jgi:hypothetical protein
MLPAVKPENVWLKAAGTARIANRVNPRRTSLHMLLLLVFVGILGETVSFQDYQAIVTIE